MFFVYLLAGWAAMAALFVLFVAGGARRERLAESEAEEQDAPGEGDARNAA